MGRRNSLSNLVNLQRFRYHHGGHSHSHHKHDEESTQPVKPMEKPQHERHESSSSSSSSTLEDDFSAMSVLSNPSMRRHSTGAVTMKSVRFGECHIRSYPQVLGDHPYCSMGCPVELGWEYSKEVEVKINDFEEQRDHQRRHKAQLLLSPEERRSILSSGSPDPQESAALRKACRRQCTRKAQRKIQREFFAPN